MCDNTAGARVCSKTLQETLRSYRGYKISLAHACFTRLLSRTATARAARLARSMRVAACALVLTACSGSLSLSFGNDPPTVSLAVAPLTLSAAGNVSLSAAAVDDSGIREVLFYRLSDNTPVQLAQLTTSPYQTSVALSKADNGSVRFFARAIDNDGASADSSVVTVTVAIP